MHGCQQGLFSFYFFVQVFDHFISEFPAAVRLAVKNLQGSYFIFMRFYPCGKIADGECCRCFLIFYPTNIGDFIYIDAINYLVIFFSNINNVIAQIGIVKNSNGFFY